MIRHILFLGCIFLTQWVLSQNQIKVLKINSVYDGDTFRVDLDCACDLPFFCKNISVRVRGIDTPEIRTKCPAEKRKGLQAKRFVQHFLRKGNIVLKNIKKGKYFRIVAAVYVGKKSLAKALIKKGLAVPYDGKTKKHKWCR